MKRALLESRVGEGLILAAVLLVATFLRFHSIGVASYWTDEFFSLQQANGYALAALPDSAKALRKPAPRLTQSGAELAWPHLFAELRTDTHPPLYFVALRLWRRLAPDGEAEVRAFSALCSLLALGLTWMVVRRRAGSRPALACAALLAVSAPQVRYAQEARSYSMAAVFVMLAVLAVDRLEAERPPWPWSGLLAASALAAMLTHYYTAGPLAGLAAFAVLALPHGSRRAALAAFGVAALAFVTLWGRVFWEQRQYVVPNNVWSLGPEAGHALATLERLCSWPALVLGAAGGGGPAWALGALGWVALACAARDRANRLWLSVIAGGVGLVLAVAVGLGGRQLEIPRYTLLAAPALAAALATLPGRFGALVPALVLVCLTARLPGAWIPDRPPWREFARLVSATARPGEAIVVVGAFHRVDAEPLSVYQALIHHAWAPDRPFGYVRGSPNRALRQALRRRTTALIVCMPDVDLSGFLPFQVEEQLEYSPEMPRLTRVSFAAGTP